MSIVSKPAISVEIGSYNRKSLLKLSIRSVREELEDFSPGYEIIVVDGGSTDGALNWLSKQKDIITICQHNRGSWKGLPIIRRNAGYFHNLAFRVAQGKYICTLTDDCLLVPGAIKNAYKLFEEKRKKRVKIGQLAFYWRNWPGSQQYSVGLTLGNRMFAQYALHLREAIQEVNYLDEDIYFFYHIDGDLSLKMWQKGWIVEASPDSYVEHLSHANWKIRRSNTIRVEEDWNAYITRWKDIYCNSKEGNIGRSIGKDFHDKSHTAWKFGIHRYSCCCFGEKVSHILSRYFPTLKNRIFTLVAGNHGG